MLWKAPIPLDRARFLRPPIQPQPGRLKVLPSINGDTLVIGTAGVATGVVGVAFGIGYSFERAVVTTLFTALLGAAITARSASHTLSPQP
jgi:hypothetical protein